MIVIWAKIITVICSIITYLIDLKKGQANFAETCLDYICIEFINDEGKKEELIIRNIKKVNFNEKEKSITFANDIGSFGFNLDNISSITWFDSSQYADANIL